MKSWRNGCFRLFVSGFGQCWCSVQVKCLPKPMQRTENVPSHVSCVSSAFNSKGVFVLMLDAMAYMLPYTFFVLRTLQCVINFFKLDAYRRLLRLQRWPWHKDLRNANNHLMSKNKFKKHSLARAKISHILVYWVARVL